VHPGRYVVLQRSVPYPVRDLEDSVKKVLSLCMAMLAVGVIAAFTATGASAHRVIPHAVTATCANSFPGDGHNGPWHTPENGGTLHGNTVHIECPTQSTHWDVNYGIQIISNGNPVWVLFDHKTGNGDLTFSESIDHSPCTDSIYAFPFRTHIGNNLTGGNVNKPGGGGGVILCA
jgi:hypothetical protein